jgi:hypothetical protein
MSSIFRKQDILYLLTIALCIPLLVFLVSHVLLNEDRILENKISKLETEIPSETNRVKSKRGFSIIKPKNWIRPSIDTEDFDETFDNKFKIHSSRSRKAHTLSISRISIDKSDNMNIINDYFNDFCDPPQSITFQNKSAFLYVSVGKSPRSTREVEYQSCFSLCFFQDGFLYNISLFFQGRYEKIPTGIWKFLNTFESSETVQECSKPVK